MRHKNIIRLNVATLFAFCAVMCSALLLQIFWHEPPCPLCLLQRIGLSMVMFGFMLNIIDSVQQRHYGVVLVGALFGATVALRQILLHITPGTPGFGRDLLSYHLYTWSFIIFALTILGVGILLLLLNQQVGQEEAYKPTVPARMICLLAIALVLSNVAASFMECGPYLACPDDPTGYWLFNPTHSPIRQGIVPC